MGEIHTLDDAPIVREIGGLIGPLSDDEAALVRTLTPADLSSTETIQHLFRIVDLLATVRSDEAMADYVYAIAPEWDGSIELLVLAGRLSTAVERYELTPRRVRRGGRGAPGSVHQADARQPQAGRVDFGGRGQIELVGPEAGERVVALALDHALDEGAARGRPRPGRRRGRTGRRRPARPSPPRSGSGTTPRAARPGDEVNVSAMAPVTWST